MNPVLISVDSSGKIWVACRDSSVAVRIDPNGGPLVVAEGQTNHVGLVDMVVGLGDETETSWFPSGLQTAAKPYNYSDMTGFNERVVNAALQPYKGYWMAVNDSGHALQLWNQVSWTAALTNGCTVEAYVRAAETRTDLGSAPFEPVTNGVNVPAIRGRFIEVRLGMMRDDPSKRPVVYDVTVHGVSSGLAGGYILG